MYGSGRVDVIVEVLSLLFSQGPLLRENLFCRRIIVVTLADRRRRHSKIIALIQSRPSTNPLFFHSWTCLSHSRRSPSFSGARTLVLSPLFFPLFPSPSPTWSFDPFIQLLLHADLPFVSLVILCFPLFSPWTRWMRARACSSETDRLELMSSSHSFLTHFATP